MTKFSMRRAVFVAALALAGTGAQAAPIYQFTGTIPFPFATNFTGYDLSTFDPATQLYYLTDRTNNGIDIFSAKTNSYVGQIGAGLFAGATPSNDNAGPNGITIFNTMTGKELIAGNGPSNLLTFNLQSDGITQVGAARTISTAVAGTTPVPANRVDGVAYAPTANTILAANNAANPGFLTLINNATGAITRTILLNGTAVSNGTTVYPNVNGDGVEATIFDAARGTYFVAVPVFNGSGSGGVIELDASNGNLLNTYDFNALGLTGICGPTGLAQGNGAKIVVACGDNGTTPVQTVILDPTGATGALPGSIKNVTGVAGGDQVAFDPVRNVFFEAARFQPGGPALGIIDGVTGLVTQALPITPNDHSVAVDPVSGQVFVAFGGNSALGADTVCPRGCIGVFAPIPEPAALPVMAMGLLGLALAVRRRA